MESHSIETLSPISQTHIHFNKLINVQRKLKRSMNIMSTKYFYKIIRRPEVLSKTGWSKSTLYNRLKEGLFPTPISLGVRSIGFVESECDRVIQAMIAGYSEQQLRDLVQDLIANRSVKG